MTRTGGSGTRVDLPVKSPVCKANHSNNIAPPAPYSPAATARCLSSGETVSVQVSGTDAGS